MKWYFKILIALAVIAAIYYIYNRFFRRKSSGSSTISNKFSPADTLKEIAAADPQLAKYVEKIARLESNHFKDAKAKESNNYGFMLAFSDSYPFGWYELKSDWEASRKKPSGVYLARNGYKYLKFDDGDDSLWAIYYKLKKLTERGKSPGYYFSLNPLDASEYLEKLNKITTKYT